jgi:hypothetical protein
MCDREDDKDAEQEPEEIGEERDCAEIFAKGLHQKPFAKGLHQKPRQDHDILVSRTDTTLRRFEDESSTPRRRISRIKARSKYLHCFQQFWPKFPHANNAMSAATTGGRGSA